MLVSLVTMLIEDVWLHFICNFANIADGKHTATTAIKSFPKQKTHSSSIRAVAVARSMFHMVDIAADVMTCLLPFFCHHNCHIFRSASPLILILFWHTYSRLPHQHQYHHYHCHPHSLFCPYFQPALVFHFQCAHFWFLVGFFVLWCPETCSSHIQFWIIRNASTSHTHSQTKRTNRLRRNEYLRSPDSLSVAFHHISYVLAMDARAKAMR